MYFLDSTSTMSSVPEKSIKKKRSYDRSHIEIVYRVRKYFEEERDNHTKVNVNQVLARTARATGIGKTLVAKIKTQSDVDEWPMESGQNVTCKQPFSVPENYVVLVRKVIREILLEKKKVPSIDEVFNRISELTVSDVQSLNLFEENVPEEDEQVWIWGRTTLYRFMLRSGFAYENKVSHYEYTKNREDVVSMRDNYLEWIQKYRDNGYSIFYQDETWVFKNMTCKKAWIDTTATSDETTLKVPSGSGERSVLSHVISDETGLLSNCMLLYRGSKSNKSSDYHSEMNWDVFSNWCETKVIPAISRTKKKSVLVLDRATYHTKLDEEDRRPTTSWNKKRLVDSIIRWGGVLDDWNEDWKDKKTKAQLLLYAKSIYPSPRYKIQKIADKFRDGEFEICILFLPVAHPELNPIEMVWGFLKRTVASRNLQFTLSHVENETRKWIEKVTVDDIAKYVRHAKEEEEKYRRMSLVVDDDS